MKTFAYAAATAAALATSVSFAGHQGDYRDRGNGRYDDRYAPRSTEFAQVVDARPIYREVRVPVSREECYDERVPVRQARVGEGGSALIGGILGYVVGNQIGGGSGRDVARVAGAVTGAAIGSDYGRRYGGDRSDYTYETRCRTVRDYRYEQTVDGYDVTYRYHGRIYHTQWPHDPGNRIPVDVNVRPVRY